MNKEIIDSMVDRSNLPGYYSKYQAVAKLTDPTEVENKIKAANGTYKSGAIFCECPELGFEGTDLLYCRYALSFPFLKVKDGDNLWIQPTIGDTERWVYTGFADCGRDSVDPKAITDTQGIIEGEDGYYVIRIGSNHKIEIDVSNDKIEITSGSNVIKMDSSANKVSINGTNLEVEV